MKSFSQVPIGVWFGAVVILLAAYLRDGWGIIVGLVLIVASSVTTQYRNAQAEAEAKAAAAEAEEPYDDGWGTGGA